MLDARPEPVILVGDSMGDIAISQPTEYRPHKVEALVYLTANLLRDGESLLEVLYQPCGPLVSQTHDRTISSTTQALMLLRLFDRRPVFSSPSSPGCKLFDQVA